MVKSKLISHILFNENAPFELFPFGLISGENNILKKKAKILYEVGQNTWASNSQRKTYEWTIYEIFSIPFITREIQLKFNKIYLYSL